MRKNKSPAVPLYRQIASRLRAQLVNSPSSQAEVLPSEPELAQTHGASRGTIRAALMVLVAEGLIRRQKGWGTMTVPEGIQRWQQMRQNRPIVIISRRRDLCEQLDRYPGQIYQGILAASQAMPINARTSGGIVQVM